MDKGETAWRAAAANPHIVTKSTQAKAMPLLLDEGTTHGAPQFAHRAGKAEQPHHLCQREIVRPWQDGQRDIRRFAKLKFIFKPFRRHGGISSAHAGNRFTSPGDSLSTRFGGNRK